MTIQYASDLHLEFKENTNFISNHPLSPKGEILVLAGDILLLGKSKFIKHPFFDWCADNFESTYIIPGNHEYYEGVDVEGTMTDYELTLRDNVTLVNNKSVVHGDSELFFTTLWSAVSPLEIVPVQMGMTDCYRIKYRGKSFSARDYADLHQRCLQWLKQGLCHSTAGSKIIVTHHCPTCTIVDPRFKGSTINSAFCVNLDSFIEGSNATYWIYGHTHYNPETPKTIGRTTLVTNQLGYVKHGENASFRGDRIIEL